jgi:hypothetical protein
VAAAQTEAQVDPSVSHFQAFLATFGLWLDRANLIGVRANWNGGHESLLPRDCGLNGFDRSRCLAGQRSLLLPSDPRYNSRSLMSSLSSVIARLCSSENSARQNAAGKIYAAGRNLADTAVQSWWTNPELSTLLLRPAPELTVGLAVMRDSFARIHEANASPRLAQVPPDQDAEEFELHFPQGVSLDILTTRDPSGSGAIARYLSKFGEGIQQVEFRCTSVDRASEILAQEFGVAPVYPQTRTGADGTRVNFFLVPSPGAGKVLIELYER